MKLWTAIAGWKIWAVIGAAVVGVVMYLRFQLDRQRRRADAAEHRAATVEKRSDHRVAMAEADKKGAEEAAKEVEKSAEKARTDNDWSRFTKP